MWKVLVVVLSIPCVLWGKKAVPSTGLCAPSEVRSEIAAAAKKAAQLPHPRLFATAKDFEALKTRAASDPLVKAGVDCVRRGADLALAAPPSRHIKQGKRLLGVSRAALARISLWAMAYRLTGEKKYLDRATVELRAVCAFSDWNPSHFLDVGEMSLAVATGYDWLYNELDPATRKEIAAGLRRNGLDASRQPAWWICSGNNWGQVCHAGILSAALALAEENDVETGVFVQRCVDYIPISMKALAPNGNYPEGPGYWNYGMEFNCIALMLLEGTLGSDFGLAKLPGFRETADYLDVVTGPSGLTFNYADGGAGRGSCFATWWLAKRFNRPDILPYFELPAYRELCRGGKRGRFPHRLFAHSLLCVSTPPADVVNKQPLVWDAQGPVPITIQRASWDRDALFVGLKAGSPSGNHGHMDGGSFVLDALGVRWAMDLGAESYYGIEKRGMNLWDSRQNSDRWKIFRLSTAGHNVLMLDNQPQFVRGYAKVVQVTKGTGAASTVVLDLSSLYPNAKRVSRTGAMAASGKSYRLTDEVDGLRAGASVRWCMNTQGSTATIEGDTIVLKQKDRTLRVTQVGGQKAPWQVLPAKGPNEWDSPNRGCQQLIFTVPASSDGKARLAVEFRFD